MSDVGRTLMPKGRPPDRARAVTPSMSAGMPERVDRRLICNRFVRAETFQRLRKPCIGHSVSFLFNILRNINL